MECRWSVTATSTQQPSCTHHHQPLGVVSDCGSPPKGLRLLWGLLSMPPAPPWACAARSLSEWWVTHVDRWVDLTSQRDCNGNKLGWLVTAMPVFGKQPVTKSCFYTPAADSLRCCQEVHMPVQLGHERMTSTLHSRRPPCIAHVRRVPCLSLQPVCGGATTSGRGCGCPLYTAADFAPVDILHTLVSCSAKAQMVLENNVPGMSSLLQVCDPLLHTGTHQQPCSGDALSATIAQPACLMCRQQCTSLWACCNLQGERRAGDTDDPCASMHDMFGFFQTLCAAFQRCLNS
jgi:hypothetical protein